MARYYDLDKLKEMIEAKADTLTDGKEAFLYVEKWLDLLPPADVVPRAVVERLQHKYELSVAERVANVKRMIELEEETARLRSILANYALQYGTVKDQHEVIDRVKRVTAMEIIATIEEERERWEAVYSSDHFRRDGGAYGYLETDVDHTIYTLREKYKSVDNNG